MRISLEQREADHAAAEARASAAAERWLDRRATGQLGPDTELDEALRELRAAARRLEKTLKREALDKLPT